MPGPRETPTLLRHCVLAVAKQYGGDTSRAFPICVAQLQKAGYLKQGTLELTAAGKAKEAEHEAEPDAEKKLKSYEKLLATARGESRDVELDESDEVPPGFKVEPVTLTIHKIGMDGVRFGEVEFVIKNKVYDAYLKDYLGSVSKEYEDALVDLRKAGMSEDEIEQLFKDIRELKGRPVELDKPIKVKSTVFVKKGMFEGDGFVDEAKGYQCMECGRKMKRPAEECPKCGSSDIDLAESERPTSFFDRLMHPQARTGLEAMPTTVARRYESVTREESGMDFMRRLAGIDSRYSDRMVSNAVVVEGLEQKVQKVLRKAGFDGDFHFEDGLVAYDSKTAEAIVKALNKSGEFAPAKVGRKDGELIHIDFGAKESREYVRESYASDMVVELVTKADAFLEELDSQLGNMEADLDDPPKGKSLSAADLQKVKAVMKAGEAAQKALRNLIRTAGAIQRD